MEHQGWQYRQGGERGVMAMDRETELCSVLKERTKGFILISGEG